MDPRCLAGSGRGLLQHELRLDRHRVVVEGEAEEAVEVAAHEPGHRARGGGGGSRGSDGHGRFSCETCRCRWADAVFVEPGAFPQTRARRGFPGGQHHNPHPRGLPKVG